MSVSREHVILTLYGSLTETPPWKSFLKVLEDYIQCRSCALLFRTPTQDDSGLLVTESHGLTGSPLMIDAFHDSPFLNLPDQKVYLLSRTMPESEFKEKHQRHYEYNQRLGNTDVLALNLTHEETGMAFRFRTMRSKKEGVFSSREVAAMEDLLPHLNNAIAIYARFVQQQQQIHISGETSSKMGLGVVVLNRDGRILTINPAADSILKTKQGFFVHAGKLRCVDKSFEEKLNKYLDLLDDRGSDMDEVSFQIYAADGRENGWLVRLQRNDIPREFRDDQSDTVSVLIRDSNQKTEISAGQIAQLFELTPAEALLAERLVQGDTLIEAADNLGRSRSTVRVQLQAIFAKTGVHKQHQLISHIMQAAGKLWL